KQITQRSLARRSYRRAQSERSHRKAQSQSAAAAEMRRIAARAACEAVDELIGVKLCRAWRAHVAPNDFEADIFCAVHHAIEKLLAGRTDRPRPVGRLAMAEWLCPTG